VAGRQGVNLIFLLEKICGLLSKKGKNFEFAIPVDGLRSARASVYDSIYRGSGKFAFMSMM